MFRLTAESPRSLGTNWAPIDFTSATLMAASETNTTTAVIGSIVIEVLLCDCTREPIQSARSGTESGRLNVFVHHNRRIRAAQRTAEWIRIIGDSIPGPDHGLLAESVSQARAWRPHDRLRVRACVAWNIATPAEQKIKKQPGQERLALELVLNPDIIATLPGGGVRVGFAAETENLAEYARRKLTSKRLHFIVANDVTAAGSGFGTETNEVVILHDDGRVEELPLQSKYAVGHAILDRVAARLG